MRSLHLLLLITLSVRTQAAQSPPTSGETNLATADAAIADFKTKKANQDWASNLPDLLPGIQKCVNDGRVSALYIVKAWPMNRGMVGVRLQAPNKKQYDCVAEHDGMRLDSVKPVKADDPPLPLSGNPLFYPAREQPPMITCGRVERVMYKKMLAGWLLYNAWNK